MGSPERDGVQVAAAGAATPREGDLVVVRSGEIYTLHVHPGEAQVRDSKLDRLIDLARRYARHARVDYFVESGGLTTRRGGYRQPSPRSRRVGLADRPASP